MVIDVLTNEGGTLMGFLDKLRELLGGSGKAGTAADGDPYGLWFYFRCNKCGSVVRIRADRRNDLNREDGPGTFLLSKEVMDNKCFQLMRAEIWFDSQYSIVSSDVTVGKLITREEYEAAAS